MVWSKLSSFPWLAIIKLSKFLPKHFTSLKVAQNGALTGTSLPWHMMCWFYSHPSRCTPRVTPPVRWRTKCGTRWILCTAKTDCLLTVDINELFWLRKLMSKIYMCVNPVPTDPYSSKMSKRNHFLFTAYFQKRDVFWCVQSFKV